MGCLLAAIALMFPRLVIIILVIAGDYMSRAYETTIWPILGFVFLPYTTLAYAICQNEGGGIQGWWIALLVLAILSDLGCWSGGEQQRRRRTG
ncbi:MAG: hypothetical protein KF787_13345 [Phycisphaeraceae bacterium]|nr:hypothetical protein [Phycisphaerae bacterium]MBX3393620.1 hypothetical protein [Phycisphaeraceae bacterium]